jgi:transcriptional regulator with XRE-family HTH domain
MSICFFERNMGPRLIQLRRRYKLSQTELGELCGVSKAAVSQWETGGAMPELRKLLALRAQLDFSLDWLLTGEEHPSSNDEAAASQPAERRFAQRRSEHRRAFDRRRLDRRRNSEISNTL